MGQVLTTSSAHRQRLLRALVASAAVAVLALVVLPGADADGERPALWSGAGQAFAVEIAFNTTPRLIPLEDLVRLDVPDAATTWDQATGTARAALLYPGSSGTGGPGMICQVGFPCPDGFPPQYPLVASAQQSTRPDDQTPDGSATAHVGEETAIAEARLTEASPAHDALSAVVELEAAHATSRQWLEGGVLNVESISAATGVSLLDGLIEIDEVRTRALSRSDGSAVHESDADVVITGVRVAGQAVEVTADGIRLADRPVPGLGFGALAPLDDVLAERGVTIRRLDAHHDDESATTSAQGTGLLVTAPLRLDGAAVPGLPGVAYRTYVTSIMIGGASSAAFVDPDGFGALGSPLPTVADPLPSGAPDVAAGGAAPSSPAPVPPPTPDEVAAPASPAVDPVPVRRQVDGVAELLGLSPSQVRALYVAGAAAAVALALGARGLSRAMHLRTRTERNPS